ncbi:PREDICTED: TMV resistance, partial [Prunus dulcis]
LANLYDFTFSAVNCFRLVEDEGWSARIISTIMKLATKGMYPDLYDKYIVFPTSEIPEWFNVQSEGHSLNVELPPESCTSWLGIAFCVAFADHQENLGNSTFLDDFDCFRIQCSSRPCWTFEKIGHILSPHILVFYLPRDYCWEQFSFEMYYGTSRNLNIFLTCLNNVNKCRARLVYEQDLEEEN